MCGLKGANTVEIDPATPYPVIHQMASQKKVKAKGGTMRLGAYPCSIREGTNAHAAYGTTLVSERHRHRFELNNDFVTKLESQGMVISGCNRESSLAEIVEIPDHPWFLACQFHPEFKSRPRAPHPLFVHYVKALCKKKGIASTDGIT